MEFARVPPGHLLVSSKSTIWGRPSACPSAAWLPCCFSPWARQLGSSVVLRRQRFLEYGLLGAEIVAPVHGAYKGKTYVVSRSHEFAFYIPAFIHVVYPVSPKDAVPACPGHHHLA